MELRGHLLQLSFFANEAERLRVGRPYFDTFHLSKRFVCKMFLYGQDNIIWATILVGWISQGLYEVHV